MGQNNSPETAATSRNTEPKKKKKGILTLVIIVAAVLAVVVSYCLVNHFTGAGKLAEGDYDGAISAYEKDFLFSSSALADAITARTEAILLAGEEAFSQQDYEKAMDLFASAGDAGKERWADAVYEQCAALLKSDGSDEALKFMDRISDEADGQAQIDAAYSLIAREFFLYSREQDYQRSKEVYEKCVNDPAAKVNAEILGELLAGNYLPAAVLADTSIISESTDLSRDEWAEAFTDVIDPIHAEDISTGFSGRAALNVVAVENLAGQGLDTREAVIRIASSSGDDWHYGGMCTSALGYSWPGGRSETVSADELNEIYARCGTAPSGKILIAAQTQGYVRKYGPFPYILWDLMRQLPQENYPCSLDEVEYIVQLDYDFQRVGVYTNGAAALREYATVAVFRAADMEQLYKSGRVNGNEPEESAWFIVGADNDYSSGGAPNMGEEIYSAISWILEQLS